MNLIQKRILFDKCEILYHEEFTPGILARDFEVKGGKWEAKDGCLVGKNPDNNAGMILAKESYYGDIMLDFKASTVLPSTHDINVMLCGTWDDDTNERGTAYVAGIEGWWQGKVGFEKAPENSLTICTGAFDFEPGREYHFQVGNINGHLFIYADGKLLMEMIDPFPIDSSKQGRLGFEAYCSHIRIRDLYIKKIAYENIEERYIPEF